MDMFAGLVAFVVMYIFPIVGMILIFRGTKEDVHDGKPSHEQDD